MALANLNINVNCNATGVVNAMADVKAVTHASMLGSSTAVTDFQKNFAKESAQVQSQSKAMGTEMNKSSVEMSKAAQVSADSISDVSVAANASLAGVKELAKGMDVAGAKIKEAIGPEAAAQVKNTTDRVEEFVATRIAIAAVGIALGAVAGTVAAVGYAAYKATGFMTGLLTGSSYKSENINALIAANKEVLELQHSLQMTAQDATALNDALARVGVNKSDITAVFGSVESKRRGDMSEWDRLGVNRKGSDGTILDNESLVRNAKKALDEYTEGWDRNQAAIALGIGTYEQLSNYLKANQEEIQISKTRLNEYNLLIGPETQKYVEQYQQAQRDFKNELELMGKGFQRVFADQVMPAYITFQNALKDGWPVLVNGTRHILATFTSMGYGIKMVFDMVWDTVSGTTRSLGGIIGAFAAAAEQALHGNFKAAAGILLTGAHDSVNTLKDIGTQITKDAENNLKAMKLAQGQFNTDYTPAGGPGSNKKGDKRFTPPPALAAAIAPIETEEFDHFINDWNRLQDKINDMNPYLTEYQREMQKINEEYDTLIGKYPEHTKELEHNRGVMIAQVKVVKDYKDGLQAAIDRYEEVLMYQREMYEASPWAGMVSGLQEYAKEAANLGDQFKDFAQNTMSSMENALTNFVTTGKMNFKDLANSIINDLVRIQMKQMVVGIFGNGSEGSGLVGSIGSAIGGWLGGARANGGPVSSGQSYLVGERGPEIFTPGTSGGITPNSALGGNVNLKVEIVNATGQPQKAKDGGMKFDGTSMVKTIILEAMDTDPSFRWAMRGGA